MIGLKYVVVDTETTVKCPIGSNKANPHWPENKIVMGGVKKEIGTEGLGLASHKLSLGTKMVEKP